MNLSDPNNWSLITWLFALAFSMSGGVVNCYARYKIGHTKIFNLIELIGETVTSGFVGLMSFILAAQYHNPIGICLLAAGAGGHMSARILFIIEKLIAKKLGYENIIIDKAP